MAKTILFSIMATVLFSGCISSKVTIKPVYSFEGRYSDKTDLTIDGQKVNIPKGKSVWIITNDTLFNILDNTKRK